jgi:hypothetical protein
LVSKSSIVPVPTIIWPVLLMVNEEASVPSRA